MIKVLKVNKAEKFLRRVTEMTEKVDPNTEPSLHNSWKIIKDAVKFKLSFDS